jgi:glycosyltransferase involved in cell wall biosynthesis
MPIRAPRISVIIPTFNHGRFIEKTIESVLNQSFQDLEIIIVDDHSTDNTKTVVQKYLDSRVYFIRHDINRGPGAARNTGIQCSAGTYIAFLDSDDEWAPEKLQLQLDLFTEGSYDLGLIYSAAEFVTNNVSIIIHCKVHDDAFKSLLEANGIVCGGSSAMIKRKCIETVGLFDESMLSSEDWDMWLRIAKSYKIKFVDKVLVRCNTHASNISADMARTITGRERLLLKHVEAYKYYPDIHAQQYYKLGIYCYKFGFMKRGQKHFQSAFKYSGRKHPVFSLKCLIQSIMPLFGASVYHKMRKSIIDHHFLTNML